jgi:hypothetical protein
VYMGNIARKNVVKILAVALFMEIIVRMIDVSALACQPLQVVSLEIVMVHNPLHNVERMDRIKIIGVVHHEVILAHEMMVDLRGTTSIVMIEVAAVIFIMYHHHLVHVMVIHFIVVTSPVMDREMVDGDSQKMMHDTQGIAIVS